MSSDRRPSLGLARPPSLGLLVGATRMPPTFWAHGLKNAPITYSSGTVLRPLEPPVVSRLTLPRGGSAPELLSTTYMHSPRGLLDGRTHAVKISPNSMSLRRLSPREWEQNMGARSSFLRESRRVLQETRREKLQSGGALKSKVRQARELDRMEQLAHHVERIVTGRDTAQGGTLTILSPDHEAAIENLIYPALQKEYDTADGEGKVAIGELRVAVRALGYGAEEEEAAIAQADRSGGQTGQRTYARTDGEARLSCREFLNVFTHSPAPPVALTRLTSMGRMLVAIQREEEEQKHRAAYGQRIGDHEARARWERHSKAEAAAAKANITKLQGEAFPFERVAESHRITALVGNFEPALRDARARAIEAAHQRALSLKQRQRARAVKASKHEFRSMRALELMQKHQKMTMSFLKVAAEGAKATENESPASLIRRATQRGSRWGVGAESTVDETVSSVSRPAEPPPPPKTPLRGIGLYPLPEFHSAGGAGSNTRTLPTAS